MSADPTPLGNTTEMRNHDPLLTPEQVAKRLNTSIDWVWDHSSRKQPMLPVIRIGSGPGRAGILRYRASKIEEFIESRNPSLPSEQDRGIHRRAGAPFCVGSEEYWA